jgi:hypothetical protein
MRTRWHLVPFKVSCAVQIMLTFAGTSFAVMVQLTARVFVIVAAAALEALGLRT